MSVQHDHAMVHTHRLHLDASTFGQLWLRPPACSAHSHVCTHSTDDYAVALASLRGFKVPPIQHSRLFSGICAGMHVHVASKGLARCLANWTLQIFQPCRVLWVDTELVSAPVLQNAVWKIPGPV